MRSDNMNKSFLDNLMEKYSSDWVNAELGKLATTGISAEDEALGTDTNSGKQTLDPQRIEEFARSIEESQIAQVKTAMSLVCSQCNEERCCQADCKLFELATKLAEKDSSFEPCKYCKHLNLNCTGITSGAHMDFNNYNID